MLPVNGPVAPGLVVLFPEIVGFCVVDQQMPIASTAGPPTETTVPPPVAVVWLIADTVAVLTVKTSGVGVVSVSEEQDQIKKAISDNVTVKYVIFLFIIFILAQSKYIPASIAKMLRI